MSSKVFPAYLLFLMRGVSYYQEYSVKSSNGSNDNKRTTNMFKCLPVVKYKLKYLKWTCSSIPTESYYDKIFFFYYPYTVHGLSDPTGLTQDLL